MNEIVKAFSEGVPTRESILELQTAMLAAGGEIGDEAAGCVLFEHFAPGLYARSLFIPAGVCVVGKIHRHAHINNIQYGRVRVVTEFGAEILEGPHHFVSEPGTKRAVYAETDTLWTTYHPTVVVPIETDRAKIEAAVIAPSFEELDRLSYTDVKGMIQ